MWEKNLEIMPRKKLKSYTSSKAEPLVSLREQAPVSDKARAAIARATESFFHDSSESNDKFEASSPMDAVREAFKQGLISDEPFWTSTVKLRNQVVHTYREDLAEEIYAALPRILSLYKNLLETLKRKVNE